MNPEARKIVQAMEKVLPPSMEYVNLNNHAALHTYLSVQMSRLLVLLAEDAEKSSEKIAGQTDRLALQIGELREISKDHKQIAENSGKSADELTKQTSKLLDVANAQKLLTEEAGRQTDRLIKLTWGIVVVSAALLVFAIVQTAVMFKQNAAAHQQQIQAGQNQKSAASQK